MDNEITLITNFFDIGRGNLPKQKHGIILPHFQHRSTEVYFNYFDKLAKIKNDMIVYTSKEYADRIYSIRKKYGLEDRTKIIALDSYCFEPKVFEPWKKRISEIMEDPKFYNRIDKPHFVEYWWPDYTLIQLMKVFYVNHAIENGLVNTNLTAWIDFGYCRDDVTLPPSNEWKYGFNPDKMHLFSVRPVEPKRPIDDIIFRGDVYVMGCHIIGGKEQWPKFKESVLKNFQLLLDNNLVHYDQTLYLMSYLINQDNFELRYASDNDWFVVFRKFNELA